MIRRSPHRVADDRVLSRTVRAPGDLRSCNHDLDRFACAAGEDDVMPPPQYVGDGPPRFLEQRPGNAALGMRRAWVSPGSMPSATPRLREDRRRRRMVEIEAFACVISARIPVDCHMNARPYIGPTPLRTRAATILFASHATFMPEVIFPGPEGRLEGRFHPGTRPRAPVALILHSHPQAGGTMNNKLVQLLYQTFVRRGFATLRFNFRGVGKSQGVFDNGIGELRTRPSALDWVQSIHPEAETTWVAGVSFGAWIGMQLLMRRPEIRGFISIAPPANMYDFSFLAPCPSSGIIIQGEADEVVTPSAVQKLVDKLSTQRHITIYHELVPGANHFFANELDLLMKSVDDYLDMRLATDPIKPTIPSRSSRS